MWSYSEAGFSLGHSVCQRLFPGAEGVDAAAGQLGLRWSISYSPEPLKGPLLGFGAVFTDSEYKACTSTPTEHSGSSWPLINYVISHSTGSSSTELALNPSSDSQGPELMLFFFSQNFQCLWVASENTEETLKNSPCKYSLEQKRKETILEKRTCYIF